jgi:hypothetical protein
MAAQAKQSNAPALRGRPIVERVNILSASVINVGGQTANFAQSLPMGEGWYHMYLRFNHILTIGTGTGAITEGELLLIKNVLLKTDAGEIIVNLPGRALYKISTYLQTSPPRKDAIAASTGTYRVTFDLQFSDEYMVRPEDTVLYTDRYNSISLQVTYGTTADILTTPGTATLAPTMDLELQRSHGPMPDGVHPAGYVSYDFDPPVDAFTAQFINLERAAEMSIKRLYVHSCTGGTGGQPWTGVNADTIQNVVNVKDQGGNIEKDRIHQMIQDVNKMDQMLESTIAGVEIFDFVRDRSLSSAMATQGKSMLQYVWTNQGGVAANSIVTATREMVRALKGITAATGARGR